MKHLITVMFIVIACGACLAWSQTPASPRASSGSSNQATANIKIETVPIQRIPRDAGKCTLHTAQVAMG